MEAHESAVLTLGLYFSLLGHVRRPRADRKRNEGWEKYKKGHELRFRLRADTGDVELVRALIAHAGFRPPNTHRKRARIIQPVYDPHLIREVLVACGRGMPPTG